MDYLKQFVIPFSGLSVGNHEYEFDLADEFFESFDYSEIKEGHVKISCRLERQERMLIFEFDINGNVMAPCDRCLEEFSLPIEGTQRLIVKFGESDEEESDEVIMIHENQNEIDLSQLFYEYVNLMIPLRKVHGVDEHGNSLCNSQVIEKLNQYIERHPEDPRWEPLRKLKEGH